MVYRFYVEKKQGWDYDATLLTDYRVRHNLGSVENIRAFYRYDIEGVDEAHVKSFMENLAAELDTACVSETIAISGARVFASEKLPDVQDEHVRGAVEFLQRISGEKRPLVRLAKVFAIYGPVAENELEEIRNFMLSPGVRSEASFAIPRSLEAEERMQEDEKRLFGFLNSDMGSLKSLVEEHSLSMSAYDIALCQQYFRSEGREPTLAELNAIDNFWYGESGHAELRTALDYVTFADELLEGAYREYCAARIELGDIRPVTLFNLGTIAARLYEKRGLLQQTDGEDGAAESSRYTVERGGRTIVDISRDFLKNNGADGHGSAEVSKCEAWKKSGPFLFVEGMKSLAARGGNDTEFGISKQDDSGMVWGGDADIAKKSPYHAAYLAVVESISKLIATGASYEEITLGLKYRFAKSGGDPLRMGQSLAALLGAFKAQLDLGVVAAGDRNTINATFENGDLPAIVCACAKADSAHISPAFRGANHRVVLLAPVYDENCLPVPASLLANFRMVTALIRSGKAIAVYSPGCCVGEGVLRMCLDSGIGFRFSDTVPLDAIFDCRYGTFIIELAQDAEIGVELGKTVDAEMIVRGLDLISLATLHGLQG